MSNLFWLNDDQWAIMAPFMPCNQPGAPRVDDRRVISGIFHVLKSGCRWMDCPRDYGPAKTIYNRYNRWSAKRFWIGMLNALADAARVPVATSIDASYVKVQRSAYGGTGGKKTVYRPVTGRKYD